MLPLECKKEKFDLVTYLLIQHEPYSNLVKKLLRQTF